MPLTGSDSVLSAALRAAMLANPDIGAIDDVGLTAMCDAIASTVLAHIVANALIPAGILVATTGTAAAQTGATTSTGVIT